MVVARLLHVIWTEKHLLRASQNLSHHTEYEDIRVDASVTNRRRWQLSVDKWRHDLHHGHWSTLQLLAKTSRQRMNCG